MGNIAVIGVCLVLLFVQGVIALARMRGSVRHAYAFTAVLCAIILAVAIMALFSGSPVVPVTLAGGLPGVGVRLRLDALSAFFLIVVNLGGAVSSLFAMGYGVHEKRPGRVLPFYPVFIAAMNLVVLADDAFTFLVSWEVMSVTSWALVMSNEEKGTARAGLVYFVMASFSALMLLFAFGILAGAGGDYGFDAIRASHPTALTTGLVLFLVLLGAGSKAGVFPLHVWLPLAHPAAPSHVSALMSGVMTKVAVYGAIRILFDLVGGSMAWWWAIPVLIVAGATALMGVLYALMQHDLKRLLAYHTVENIGIIFIGLGLAIAFRANGLYASSALALTAALLHVFNHSLFKSLLFLGSGAVLHATGERDIDHLGGLIHNMPYTAFFFLAGSAAISALPPLNGFVSEWLIFQSILASPRLGEASLAFLIPVIGVMLALAAALAAACFVKAFGVTFLGRARSDVAQNAHETDRYSLAAMAVLAFLCLLIGILPSLAVDVLRPVSQLLTFATLPPQDIGPAPLSLVPFANGRSSYNGMIIFAFLLISGGLTAWFIHRFASRAIGFGDAWDCGHEEDNRAAQYTAASFSQPIRRVFGAHVFRAREHVEMPPPGSPAPAVFESSMTDPALFFVLRPLSRLLEAASRRSDVLQQLTIRRYLALVFMWVVVLLIAVAAWN
ncbi:MAG TPA: hydrogenase 4 subunit B [Rhizobiales bacterium]|nr:hydrogenase 4 subunit B [Hyphomicrobiales bacterium]